MFTFVTPRYTMDTKFKDKKPIQGAANIQALCVFSLLFFFIHIFPVLKPLVISLIHIVDS